LATINITIKGVTKPIVSLPSHSPHLSLTPRGGECTQADNNTRRVHHSRGTELCLVLPIRTQSSFEQSARY